MPEMDFRNVIYNAARDGKLRRLKVFLEHRSKVEVLMLVAAKTNGATPLVMACRNGHFDVAEYLIEHCDADIEQPGSVVFDGETIEGAPPLWCAAAAGHLPVVKLLVRNGASVNSTTRTNSTPLRAACFDGHFEIVKFLVDHGADIEVANRHGHTCLMIACYKGHFRIAKFLLSLDANVNRKSVKGNTALHDCAESGSLEILKLLIEHGAKMDVDSYGMTPLLAASVTGHTHIVEYLIQLPELVSRTERVDALELLGATYVDKKRDMIGALAFWKRAMEDRYLRGLPELPKPVQKISVAAYDHVQEIRDPNDLEDLLADPDEMRMQALVIRERILGPAHPDTSYYIRYRGAVYADAGKFNRCVALWNYALDMQQRMLEPLNPMTQSSLFSFAELFSFMMGEQGRVQSSRGRRVPPVTFDDIITVFRKAVCEVESGLTAMNRNAATTSICAAERDAGYLQRVLTVCLHIACLMTRILPDLTPAQSHEAYCVIYKLVHQDVRAHLGLTILHLACARDAALASRYPACQFPSAQLAEALLKVGADPCARDELRGTPLHHAALLSPCPPDLAKVLLDHGAHLDAVDYNGRTFATLLRGQTLQEIVNPVRYTSLFCLAAQTIVRHKIPYKGLIPPSFEDFIEIHCTVDISKLSPYPPK